MAAQIRCPPGSAISGSFSDESLIEAVHNFPCLWNNHSSSFKDLKAKENAWAKVAEELNRDVEVCKKRWKVLRDVMSKELRKTKGKKSGDSGPPYTSHWGNFYNMLFIQDCIKHRKTSTNYRPSVEQAQEDSESLASQEELDFDQSFIFPEVPPTPPSSSTATPTPTSSSTATPTPTSSSTATPTATPPPIPTVQKRIPQKRQTTSSSALDVQKTVLAYLKGLQDLARVKAEATDNPKNPNVNFCMDVANRMNELPSDKCALAKIRIQTLLYELECMPDHASMPLHPPFTPYTSFPPN